MIHDFESSRVAINIIDSFPVYSIIPRRYMSISDILSVAMEYIHKYTDKYIWLLAHCGKYASSLQI